MKNLLIKRFYLFLAAVTKYRLILTKNNRIINHFFYFFIFLFLSPVIFSFLQPVSWFFYIESDSVHIPECVFVKHDRFNAHLITGRFEFFTQKFKLQI